MMLPQFIRHAAASRHVAKREDYLVQGYLRLLREDNVKLREQLHALKPVGFSRSGRSAFGRVVAALLLGCVVMAGIFWWKQSSDAEAFRDGVRNGWVAVRTGI